VKISLYQIDAFSRQPFAGNPAAVCILDAWLDDRILQQIAAENNLSETAFVVGTDRGYDLRWFTPELEVDLCGHATLASAYAVFRFLNADLHQVSFSTRSGILNVARDGELLTMDFPARSPAPTSIDPILVEAVGIEPLATWRSRDLLVLLPDAQTVSTIVPNLDKLTMLADYLGVIVTAPGEDCDFVSRFFAPRAGIAEDPVTGSAHCTLIPFWAERLGKNSLHARQLSKRGGELWCEHLGDRVKISGHCALFLTGAIEI
jgi:PhzF family phenazine biosynthesis protein